MIRKRLSLAALILGLLIAQPSFLFAQANLPSGARLRIGSGANPLLGLRFSPDGKILATGGYDARIELWDPRTGTRLRSWKTSEGSIASLVFSPDGLLLASGGVRDPIVHLWDIKAGKLVRDFPGLPRGVTSLDFSPDGKFLLAGGYGTDNAFLWEVSTGKALGPLVGKEAPTLPDNPYSNAIEYAYLAFAPDGKSFASGHAFGLVRIWDAVARRETNQFRSAVSDQYMHVAFARDGKTLATWGESISLWSAPSWKQRRVFGEQADMRVAALSFSPNGRLIASASSGETGADGLVHIWETATGSERMNLAGHEYAVSATAFAPDNRTFASASRDGTVLVWDLRSCPAAGEKAELVGRDDLETMWNDLGQSDAALAFRAIRGLLLTPARTAKLLESHLQPLQRARPEQITEWIYGLNSKSFKTRTDAALNLAIQLEVAEPLLKQALPNQFSPQSRRQLEQILKAGEQGDLTPLQLQRLRAVEILEEIASPEAGRILATIAGGDQGFRLTSEASAACNRLKQRLTSAK